MQAKSGWDIDEAEFPRKGPPETRAWFSQRSMHQVPRPQSPQ